MYLLFTLACSDGPLTPTIPVLHARVALSPDRPIAASDVEIHDMPPAYVNANAHHTVDVIGRKPTDIVLPGEMITDDRVPAHDDRAPTPPSTNGPVYEADLAALTPIAVVARPIGAGQALTADDVLMVDYPDVLRPPCTFAAASDVVGRTATARMFRNDLVRAERIGLPCDR